MGSYLERLKEEWSRISRLEQALNLLSWDMETYMPEQGVKARAGQISLLAGVLHDWLTKPEIGRLIDGAEKESSGMPAFSDEASMVRVARRIYEKKVRVPKRIVERLADTAARANSIWISARAHADFGEFSAVLSELIDLNREQADCLGWRDHPYDALIDLYEPDMTTADIDRIFTDLKSSLLPLVRDILPTMPKEKHSLLSQKFNVQSQEAFGLAVIKDMGFDFKRGRQDRSAHPFTTSFSPYDVRITTRFSDEDPLSGFFSTVHECGHALYDQGLPLEFIDTPLCQPISLGVHESQSRLWENVVARSLPFWRHYLPIMKRRFPGQLDELDAESFYKIVNRSEAGLIRVEADELTHNLHIFVRFEIEKEIIAGTLATDDVPSFWNQKYRDYLGVSPPDDAAGCLQDIHWAHGAFGYFPTYTIGNILSAQLYEAALSHHPSISEEIEKGDFASLLAWLRERIHRHGARYTTSELIQEITGGPIRVESYLNYLENKFRALAS